MTQVESYLKAPRASRRVDYSRGRLKVIERSQGRCEAALEAICNGRGNQAHHIRRRSQGGDHSPANLVWICEPCHTWAHAHPAEAVDLGLLARTAAPMPTSNAVTRVERVER